MSGFCHGHNWLNIPSRAAKASFDSPCKPRANINRAHVQVGPGQKFPVEWATGHPGSREHYFVIISGKDQDKLKLHTLTMLDDYIKNAPEDTYMQDPKNHKFHVAFKEPPKNVYAGEVKSNEDLYIIRPQSFANRTSVKKFSIHKFPENKKTRDVRAQYKSDN
eukprot:TRINITY_DN5536_c0_g1_i1.p1 TRINITY_DN5536_c0_g1~~TRINITY_DN5536_c0_g1_i1.p1  ORF type:complete len:171 (+),score=11.80 TRINITY_DN5536_c0_g1_i1:25-513(+)